MRSGWIKLHRSLLEWEWYQQSEMVHLFLHLLFRANYTEGRWQGLTIKRGQLVTGRKKLAAETGLSERQVRTCLKRLETTNEVTTRPTNRYTLITVCNYDDYQGGEPETDQPSDQQIDQPKTSQRPASDQPATTSKEGKKGRKEEKKKRGERGTLLSDEQMGEFKDVWLQYLDYRGREKKGKYKSATTEMKGLQNLISLADGDKKVAQKIVEQTEANGWTGLHPLKTKSNGRNSKEEKYRNFAKD